MGEAKRRKKLDPNWGKAPKRRKVEIVVLEGMEEEYDQTFPPVPESVIDYFYIGISEGKLRGVVRFDVYEYWVNPDLTVETKNELLSMVWRTDGVKDDEMTGNWAKKNEQYVRDYGTESWVKLRYRGVLANS